jgi:hypothetical protein
MVLMWEQSSGIESGFIGGARRGGHNQKNKFVSDIG